MTTSSIFQQVMRMADKDPEAKPVYPFKARPMLTRSRRLNYVLVTVILLIGFFTAYNFYYYGRAKSNFLDGDNAGDSLTGDQKILYEKLIGTLLAKCLGLN
jgi:hypothetical protein